VGRLLNVLIQKLDLPVEGPDGSEIGYQLYHERTGKTLGNSEMLCDIGLANNDAFAIRPGQAPGTDATRVPLLQVEEAEEAASVNQGLGISWRWAQLALALLVVGSLIFAFVQYRGAPESSSTGEDLHAKMVSKTWQFSHGDGDVIAERIRLTADGRMEGYYHQNEARWDIEGDQVVFYQESGEPSCRLSIVSAEDERTILRGALLFDPSQRTVHVLTEVR
jgi:hypothetical protein